MAAQRTGASEATFSALHKRPHGFHDLQATEHAQQVNASIDGSTVALHLVNAQLASRQPRPNEKPEEIHKETFLEKERRYIDDTQVTINNVDACIAAAPRKVMRDPDGRCEPSIDRFAYQGICCAAS